ncbi:MAG TPA: amidohydrolase family protein, partial [Acidimicrobiales bacterium]|nr:amidohydrolase family protein [Acidimicrobiales bacterium]
MAVTVAGAARADAVASLVHDRRRGGAPVAEHDLIIRGATVVDGSGEPPFAADVAVAQGVITEVGRVAGTASREIDADGAVVAPGWVDIHAHYDGQATWESRLIPSSWHGVTTVVVGNCGVGFAPVRTQDRERLIELMEGVEDIPGTALHEGLAWDWESFPEYMDAVASRPHDIDIGLQVPHGALRLYVMGERGAVRDAARPEEIAEMARLAREAVEAGALGFTTSRTRNHRTSRGDWTPTLTAAANELAGIAEGLGAAGRGVLEVVSDFLDLDEEAATIIGMARASGRPLSISVVQADLFPERWREIMGAISEARA